MSFSQELQHGFDMDLGGEETNTRGRRVVRSINFLAWLLIPLVFVLIAVAYYKAVQPASFGRAWQAYDYCNSQLGRNAFAESQQAQCVGNVLTLTPGRVAGEFWRWAVPRVDLYWTLSLGLFLALVFLLFGYFILVSNRKFLRFIAKKLQLLKETVEVGPIWELTSKLTQFRDRTATEVVVGIDAPISGFANAVKIVVTIRGRALEALPLEQDPVDILHCWIKRVDSGPGPDDLLADETAPLIIHELKLRGRANPAATTPLKTIVRDGRSTVQLRAGEQSLLGEDLSFQFTALNAFRSLGKRLPLDLHVLEFSLATPQNDRPIIAYIDVPHEIALRGRNDGQQREVDASYYSVGIGLENDRQRNIAFYPNSAMNLANRYGRTNAAVLSEPARHLFYSALSLLSAGFALKLLTSPGGHLQFLAAITFALSVTSSFTDALSARRLFFPSSSFGEVSTTSMCALFGIILQLTTLSLVGYAITTTNDLRETNASHVISTGAMATGVLLLIFAVIYVLLLHRGVLLGYSCDQCQRRIWDRRSPKHRVPEQRSRFILCTECSAGLLTPRTPAA